MFQLIILVLKFPLARACFVVILLFSNACSNVQSVVYDGLNAGRSAGLLANHKIDRTNHWVLPVDSSFYVAVNSIGSEYGDTIGVKVSEIIHQEVSKRFHSVMKADAAESLDYAKNSANLNGLDYLVYPNIFVWRDTPGTWTEIGQLLRSSSSSAIVNEFGLNRVMVQIVLLESSTGLVIDIASIESQSGLLTLYEESPDSLLVTGVGQYFQSLQRY